MSFVMMMRWDGVTLEQYDRALKLVRWEEEPAAGGIFHVATHDGDALRVTDIWETPEHFQQFVDQRLMPGVAELGLPGQPVVEMYPAHRIFEPGPIPQS